MLNFKENKTTFLFTVSILCFGFFKYYYHGETAFFDLEEVYKTVFITDDHSLSYFFPGNHSKYAFFGHPGINNFLYLIFSTLFGKSIISVRLFSLLVSLLLVISYFNFIAITSSRNVAFYSSLTLLLLPMFNIQSICFYNEIGSLAFVLLSLIFLKKEKLSFFSLTGIIAILYLESAFAFYASILIFALIDCLKDRDKRKNIKVIMATSMPIISLLIFFLCEYLATGNLSNHITVDLVYQNLMNPTDSIKHLLNNQFMDRLHLTLSENFSHQSLIMFSLVPLYHFVFKRKSWHLNWGIKTILLPTFFFLLYFNLFSIFYGGRDFYVLFLFLFYYYFYFLNKLKFGNILSLISLLIISINSYQQLNKNKMTSFQTSLKEYEISDDYVDFTNKVKSLTKGYHCYVGKELFFNKLFCHSFFGFNHDLIPTSTERRGNFFIIFKSQELIRIEDFEKWAKLNNYKFDIITMKPLANIDYKIYRFYKSSRDQEGGTNESNLTF